MTYGRTLSLLACVKRDHKDFYVLHTNVSHRFIWSISFNNLHILVPKTRVVLTTSTRTERKIWTELLTVFELEELGYTLWRYLAVGSKLPI
jgi:hypothetical protein